VELSGTGFLSRRGHSSNYQAGQVENKTYSLQVQNILCATCMLTEPRSVEFPLT
jgi:hypothetical protein